MANYGAANHDQPSRVEAGRRKTHKRPKNRCECARAAAAVNSSQKYGHTMLVRSCWKREHTRRKSCNGRRAGVRNTLMERNKFAPSTMVCCRNDWHDPLPNMPKDNHKFTTQHFPLFLVVTRCLDLLSFSQDDGTSSTINHEAMKWLPRPFRQTPWLT